LYHPPCTKGVLTSTGWRFTAAAKSSRGRELCER
jgi:hypothetical protein